MSSHVEDAMRLFAEREQALGSRDTDTFLGASHPRGNETEDEARLGLVEAGTRRLLAERLAADARADGLAWMHVALTHDISQAEIGRLLGMSREAVRQAKER